MLMHFYLLLLILTSSLPTLAATDHKTTSQSETISAPISPKDILVHTDEVRNPAESYFMKVRVGGSLFEVLIQGGEDLKTVVRTLEPSRDRGRNMLMINEEMWAFIPNLNRAVRVSLGQKLTGQAANGDISRMRWSGDYSAQIESETEKEWVLFLTANKKGLTYEKIRAWIEKGTYFPKKAQFLTLNGKPLKNATYEDYRPMAGKIRPLAIRIQDAVRQNDVSLVQIEEMTVKQFPASIFNQNALK